MPPPKPCPFDQIGSVYCVPHGRQGVLCTSKLPHTAPLHTPLTQLAWKAMLPQNMEVGHLFLLAAIAVWGLQEQPWYPCPIHSLKTKQCN